MPPVLQSCSEISAIEEGHRRSIANPYFAEIIHCYNSKKIAIKFISAKDSVK
ncbi:Hypothetical predicted protein [Podarcis lilfordi]|uniref:Uncharacterized protein n=1 Tax=Podarcis lilfordi TaxID=74358 RepID=A0AA35P0C8_9SAUR|nr:Hypothetical predicted protein [Podarcis lilfordi]